MTGGLPLPELPAPVGQGVMVPRMPGARLIAVTRSAPWLPAGSTAEAWAGRHIQADPVREEALIEAERDKELAILDARNGFLCLVFS